MSNLIESAIEREAEQVDALLDTSALLDRPAYPWTPIRARVNPLTRNFSPRGTRRPRVAKLTESKPRYLN